MTEHAPTRRVADPRTVAIAGLSTVAWYAVPDVVRPRWVRALAKTAIGTAAVVLTFTSTTEGTEAREGLRSLRDAAREADAVLVEPRVPQADGGTGTALDPSLAREARARLARATMVLAGGLTPETVGPVAALVRPEVVDVSSGVECLPGIKDPEKIARFLEAVFGHSAIS
jgi:phosphoribosylanthranilate isomerase